MYIPKNESKREDWDKVKSWNYKLPNVNPQKSVVYAEIVGEHGEIATKNSEWIYYIIEGEGEFNINGIKTNVSSGDVISVPPKTKYNYVSKEGVVLKVIMYIDLWDN